MLEVAFVAGVVAFVLTAAIPVVLLLDLLIAVLFSLFAGPED